MKKLSNYQEKRIERMFDVSVMILMLSGLNSKDFTVNYKEQPVKFRSDRASIRRLMNKIDKLSECPEKDAYVKVVQQRMEARMNKMEELIYSIKRD